MLYVPAAIQPTLRQGIYHSLRFQLAVVLVGGVWLPLLGLLGLPLTPAFANGAVINSSIGASLAGVILVMVLRQVANYPGTRVVRYILPTLCALYGGLLAIVSLLRVDYSNSILLVCFVCTLATRFAITSLHFRAPPMVFGLVPGGRVDTIEALHQMTLVKLQTPTLPKARNWAIIADLHHDLGSEWERFLAEAAIGGLPVYHYKQVWEATTGEVTIDHLSENSFGSLMPARSYSKIKRLTDLALTLVFAPILIPAMAVIALLVKLDSPGPVIFSQTRMGYRGRTFRVHKFRTMHQLHDGHDRTASMTLDCDVRITRIGRFLRRTRADELPQVWNIIKGEMSWIGPRPEAISLSQWYEAELPFYRYRHIVRPGITGWAQVHQGHVTSVVDVQRKLRYDFYYIKNFSYWLDVLILFRTMRVIINGFGSR